MLCVVYQVIADHPEVAEVAVVGLPDKFRGHIPFALIVLNSDSEMPPAEVEQQVIESVREKIGAVVAFRKVICVHRLPKTRSGKILRSTLRKIANKEPYKIPPTIEEPEVLVDIEKLIQSHHE